MSHVWPLATWCLDIWPWSSTRCTVAHSTVHWPTFAKWPETMVQTCSFIGFSFWTSFFWCTRRYYNDRMCRVLLGLLGELEQCEGGTSIIWSSARCTLYISQLWTPISKKQKRSLMIPLLFWWSDVKHSWILACVRTLTALTAQSVQLTKMTKIKSVQLSYSIQPWSVISALIVSAAAGPDLL